MTDTMRDNAALSTSLGRASRLENKTAGRSRARPLLYRRTSELRGRGEGQVAGAEFDRLGPEALETTQRLVRIGQVIGRNDALAERAEMALMHLVDLLVQRQSLVRQADADRAAVMRRTFLHGIAVLEHLLDVVGDVGAEIAAAQGQLADRHLEIADIEQDHRLHVVDVVD